MIEWWLAHMRHAPPALLLELSGGASPSAQTARSKTVTRPSPTVTAPISAPTTPADEPAAPPAPQRTGIDIAAESGMDLAAIVERQRQLVAAAYRLNAEAIADPTVSEATLTFRQKRYADAVEQLRTVELALAKLQAATGELVPRDAIRADVAPLLAAMTDSLAAELAEKLGVARPLAVEFADNWFATLRASRFFAPEKKAA